MSDPKGDAIRSMFEQMVQILESGKEEDDVGFQAIGRAIAAIVVADAFEELKQETQPRERVGFLP